MQRSVDALRAAQRPFIIAHIAPDGDCLGAALGLYWGLRQLGKQPTVACGDAVPGSFAFLPGSEVLVHAAPPNHHDLILAIDASDLARLGTIYDPAVFGERPLVNIDHHVTNQYFGNVNWVEPSAASTSEMIYMLLSALGVAFDPVIATCLLTGIVTDTLGFRTTSTKPELLEIAAALMRAGASLTSIIERAFNTKTLASLRLWGKVLERLQTEGEIIWSENTRAMRQECGAALGDASGAVGFLLGAREAHVSVLFVERDDGDIEVGIRARPGHDISQVALNLGGGGHPQAAGCVLKGDLTQIKARVLDEIRRSLDGHEPT